MYTCIASFTVLPDTAGRLTLEAAEAIGDPRLYPALVELKSCCPADAPLAALLEDALASCAPR
jgi:hypothetical protein